MIDRELAMLAIPVVGMVLSYIYFRMVRRSQKRWHAEHGRHEAAE